MPSDKKPSTDQVLTNTLRGFGLLARWVSRSAICTPLTPSRWARRAHSSLLFGSGALSPRSLARLTSACLTNQETMPGLAPQHETAVSRRDSAPFCQHRLAQRVIGARVVAERLVVIEARPGLDDGVDVERADLAAMTHEVERRGVDRQVDAEALAEPAVRYLVSTSR